VLLLVLLVLLVLLEAPEAHMKHSGVGRQGGPMGQRNLCAITNVCR